VLFRSVAAFSGRSGTLLYSVDGSPSYGGEQLGWALDAGYDLSGDGVPDFVTGYPYVANSSGSLRTGVVQLRSGLDGTLFRTLWGTPGVGFGQAVKLVPDIDGDSVADLLVGTLACGVVYIYSGRDFTPLGTLLPPSCREISLETILPCGDWDGDGNADVAVGTPADPGGPMGSVFVFSLANDSLLTVLTDSQGAETFGYALAAADFDGDGKEDLAVGAPRTSSEDGFDTGSVEVICQAGNRFIASGNGSDQWYAAGLCAIPDMSRDGRPDLVVGIPGWSETTGAALVLALTDVTNGRAIIGSSNTVALGRGQSFVPALLEPDVVPADPNEFTGAYVTMRALGNPVFGANAIQFDSQLLDRDGDGDPDMRAEFLREDLRKLSGSDSVMVEVFSKTGVALVAEELVDWTTESVASVSVSPNPVRSSAVVTVHTFVPGPLKISLYNVRGELISVLRDEHSVQPGYYDAAIRKTAPSGIYFLKVEASKTTFSRKVALLR